MDLLDKYVIDGNLKSIKTVINGFDWKLDSEWNDYNLLKKALIYKHKKITKFFIAKNFRVNKFSMRDADTTPLHIAVELEWKDVVSLLLKKGASVEVQDNTSDMTPIQLSFFMRKYELTDLMLPFDKGQSILDSNINTNHLHIACARNCVSAVKNYLRLGESIDNYSESSIINWMGYTPLHFAVDFQSREIIELLLKCGASITATDKKMNTPLHLASNLHDKSFVDLLLSEHKYISSNPKNSYYVSHFHIACTRNNPKVVYRFLLCDVNINATIKDGPWEGYTALHLAVRHQCVDVVKLLLSQDDLKEDNSENFLFNVYKTGNSEIINLITSENKSLIATEFSGKIPLTPFFKACIIGDKLDIESLISSGIPVNEQLPLDSLLFPGATPLHILVGHDLNFISEIIDLILQAGANVTAKDARGLTPIHLVFSKNHYEAASLMKDYSRFKSNVSDKEGLSLFHIACAVGIKEVVDWFLDDFGVDVNVVVSEDSLRYPGFTPLHMAALHMSTRVLLSLLSHGANVMIKNREGLTPFNLLIQCWSFNYRMLSDDDVRTIMSHLIEVYKRDYITFDGFEFNFLHAACIVGDKNLLEHWMKDKIAMDSALNSALSSAYGWFAGCTPLHFAVLKDNVEMIEMLLDLGADPAARSAEGDTPLHMSIILLLEEINLEDDELCMHNCDDRLYLLQENPFGSCGFSHFHIACQFDDVEVVNAFLNRGVDPDIRTRKPHSIPSCEDPWINETGLHAAMRTGNYGVMLLLLERDADANARDMFQRTPLHMIMHDDDSMVRLLVESGGADVNARNGDGETPLHVTCRRRVIMCSVVNALLEAGADVDLMDKCGLTVIDIIANTYDLVEPNEVVISIIQHAFRLNVARRPISKNNEEALDYQIESQIDLIGRDFETRCSEELQRMERVRLGGRTTLRDVLPIRNADQLRRLAGNKLLQRLVVDELSEDEEKNALDKFPIYGYLARLQFRRGQKRRQMTPMAVLTIRKLVENYCTGLPDECAEIILSYLTDDDLERLNRAAK